MPPRKAVREAPRPVISEVEIVAIQDAIEPLDRVAVEMEARWGAGRLPRLVTPETAARFGAAKAKLDSAIMARDVPDVCRRASVMIRGWQAMDKEARERGADTWEGRAIGVRWNGQAWHVVWDRAELDYVIKKVGGEDNVVTVSELLHAWKALKDRIAGVEEVRKYFPGGEVTKVNLPPGGDDIPF
ncbi:MAG: hypothetical protein OEZ19_00210 [Paracoccaceae bacterium]|nr:hypothetical protein [Paracoccaceae bacterium]